MKTILLLMIILITGCNGILVTDKETGEKTLRELAEAAYFEGQADALNGDIRIKFTNDSCWIWTKSPWSDNRLPIYNISNIKSRTNYK